MCARLFLLFTLTILWGHGGQCKPTQQQQQQQQANFAFNITLSRLKLLDEYIVSGSQLLIKQVPHQCALTIIKLKNRSALCGCVILNQRFVLTAAHCLKDETTKKEKNIFAIKVHVGVSDIYETRYYHQILEYVQHENYAQSNSLTPTSDIAIIMLAKNLKFNKKIRPIKIIKDNLYTSGHKPVYVSGYGNIQPFNAKDNNTALWGTSMVTVSHEKCKETWGNLGVRLDDTVICAQAPAKKLLQSVCRGDSGGPMITDYDPPSLIGITSFGSANCTQAGDAPAVFTNVHYFHNWTRKQRHILCKKHGCLKPSKPFAEITYHPESSESHLQQPANLTDETETAYHVEETPGDPQSNLPQLPAGLPGETESGQEFTNHHESYLPQLPGQLGATSYDHQSYLPQLPGTLPDQKGPKQKFTVVPYYPQSHLQLLPDLFVSLTRQKRSSHRSYRRCK